MREVKREIKKCDRRMQMNKCVKAPLIAEVEKRGGSWLALWDTALHLGSCHATGLQHLSRTLVSGQNHVLFVITSLLESASSNTF